MRLLPLQDFALTELCPFRTLPLQDFALTGLCPFRTLQKPFFFSISRLFLIRNVTPVPLRGLHLTPLGTGQAKAGVTLRIINYTPCNGPKIKNLILHFKCRHELVLILYLTMKIFKIILVILVIVVITILGLAFFQPSTFEVKRSITINETPEKVFPHVNSMKKYTEYNPWGNIDPNEKITFSGPASGVGSKFRWEGNYKVGIGELEITKSIPNKEVEILLNLIKPMKLQNKVIFNLQKVNVGTIVTWTMRGDINFIGKIINVFISMDKMDGPQFEKGLNKLKQIVENQK